MTNTKQKSIDERAREERLAYFREWRAKNKERVKKHNADYWRRRAEKTLAAEKEATTNE